MENTEALPGPVVLDLVPLSCAMEISRSRDPETTLPSSLRMRLRLLDEEVRTPDGRDLTHVEWTLTLYENGTGNETTKRHNAAGMINYYAEQQSDHFDIDDSPEACHAWASVDAETFSLVRGMALAGRLPTSFRLHASGMDYGWEPDGSAKVWHVKAHKNALIDKLEIVASLVELPSSANGNDGALSVSPPESAELAALRGVTKAVNQVTARLGWVIALLALVVAVLILR